MTAAANATLIRGATIVTMDRQGDLHGDILIEGDTIAEIAPSIAHASAQVVEAHGCIAIPGLVNAHMHTWQTALRGIAANWTLPEYFRKMHAGLATVFTAEDLYIATYVGALNQLNCGTTTLADWCHNNPTPAHNDAAIAGLLEVGHPRRVLPRHAEARSEAGPAAVLGSPASAGRDRAPAEGAPGPRAARHPCRGPRPALFDARGRAARLPDGAASSA